MVSRICDTSASDSSLTRRCSGMPAFLQTSLANLGPIPWMYWRAMITRFWVGMFTPAMRATSVSWQRRRRLWPAPPAAALPVHIVENAREPAPALLAGSDCYVFSREVACFLAQLRHHRQPERMPRRSPVCSSFGFGQNRADFLGH